MGREDFGISISKGPPFEFGAKRGDFQKVFRKALVEEWNLYF
jgi:hypothetical protein